MVTLTLRTLVMDLILLSWVALMAWNLATAERDRDLLLRIFGKEEDPE